MNFLEQGIPLDICPEGMFEAAPQEQMSPLGSAG